MLNWGIGAHRYLEEKTMHCFLLGYIGPGISINQLLETSTSLLSRAREGFGLVMWEQDNEKPSRIRAVTTWDGFYSQDKNQRNQGVVNTHLTASNRTMDTKITKGIVHGLWEAAGRTDFPISVCNPYFVVKEDQTIYFAHNGRLNSWTICYQQMVEEGYPPEAQTESATCSALLAKRILGERLSEVEAGISFVNLMQKDRSTGAVLFSSSRSPKRLFGIRITMPLIILKSKLGVFLASDVNIARGLPDSEFELYCLREGAVGYIDDKSNVNFQSVGEHEELAHYGKMILPKEVIKARQGMARCVKTMRGVHWDSDWDLRTLRKWSIWPQEERCLSCACELAEEQGGAGFKLNQKSPITLS